MPDATRTSPPWPWRPRTRASPGRCWRTSAGSQAAGSTVNNNYIRFQYIDIEGGSVSGSGTWRSYGAITIGAGTTVSPGNSPGTMTWAVPSSGLDFDGELDIQIDGTGFGDYDLLKVLGAGGINFGSHARIRFLLGYNPLDLDTLELLQSDALGGFGNIQFSIVGLGAGYGYQVFETTGFDLDIRFFAPGNGGGAAPEPATLLLCTLGFGTLAWARRRRGAESAPQAG